MVKLKNVILLVFLISFAQDAYAYLGPGLGAGTIGVIIGFLASIFVALFAIFWYPIKRLLKKFTSSSKTP